MSCIASAVSLWADFGPRVRQQAGNALAFERGLGLIEGWPR